MKKFFKPINLSENVKNQIAEKFTEVLNDSTLTYGQKGHIMKEYNLSLSKSKVITGEQWLEIHMRITEWSSTVYKKRVYNLINSLND